MDEYEGFWVDSPNRITSAWWGDGYGDGLGSGFGDVGTGWGDGTESWAGDGCGDGLEFGDACRGGGESNLVTEYREDL